MKNILKVAVLAAAVMAAQPALAHKCAKETTVGKDGKPVAAKCIHKHKRSAKHNEAYYNDNTQYGHGTRRYDHKTYLGHPIQGNGNPEEARQAARAVQKR